MSNQESILLQMHYHFKDENSHSMNAIIHNECEKQFIHALKLLNKYLDTVIIIKVIAKDEGGIKDIYEISIKNTLILIILTALITSSMQQFFTSNFRPAINVTEETKNKLDNLSKIKEMLKEGNLTSEEFDYIVENDKDLKKLKSNFFKSAKQEESITKIEFEDISPNSIPIFDKQTIEYSDFDKCIIIEEQEKNDSDIDAKIYIVAPVLVRGRKDHWKGIYEEESIDFKISDKDFLEKVYEHEIKFCNGTYINCKMKIIRTLNKNDNTEKINREIIDVENWGDEDGFRILSKKKKKLKNNDSELTLFDLDQL